MEENLTIKEFFEEVSKNSPVKMLDTARKLIELESIERYINLVYGVELEIRVKPAEKMEGRFFGKGLIEKL